ncbi:polysaccharide deacetylase family protein [Azohydromonas sediminis]|uniref:polysaccharide deacetylase family protein n=1 Tax=Azohydromonas sediminis TaxID=2259674 RepID=UPI000E657F1D|nr:polysaccharide deacetylase family protein [Azohydromonas sediminis]
MSAPTRFTRMLLRRRGDTHGAVSLMYHAVTPGSGTPAWPWAVSMGRLRQQLDHLVGEGYAAVTVSELQAGTARAARHMVAITFDDGYVDNLEAVDELYRRGMRATWFVVSGSIGRAPAWKDPGRPPTRLLTAAELRDMASAGMEIGSHTVSHARLPDCGAAQLHAELHDSKATLEDAIGQPVKSFAYPYGLWDERCEEAVRTAGYQAACHTRTGWALHDLNPLRIRRLTVFNQDTVDTFARKIVFASHDVDWAHMVRYVARRVWQRATRGK